ncbi:MAG: hypothetical protein LBR53_06785 [Deltaproteobacteria bacterium]|nr:hypothetical protein [Deltaproteobacteria bacterium]
MKSAFLTAAVSFIFCLSSQPTLAGPNVLDISELKSLGLSDSTIENIVAVSLSPRARPPLDADFIKLLATHGGDGLTKDYLDLDALSSGDGKAPLSPDSVRKLISARVAADEIRVMIRDALEEYRADDGKENAPSAGATDAAGSGPYAAAGVVAAGAAAGSGLSAGGAGADSGAHSPELGDAGGAAPSGAWNPEDEDFSAAADGGDGFLTAEDLLRESEAAGAMGESEHLVPLTIGNAGGSMAEAEAESRIPERAAAPDPRKTPQTLRRGQKADPSRPMPADGRMYPVREPEEDDEYFMGSYRYETLDGHQVDVHRASKSGVLGTRVESRAGGQKVHRYFSGRPEKKAVRTVPGTKRSASGGTPNEMIDYFE